jgi:hypothetical protein
MTLTARLMSLLRMPLMRLRRWGQTAAMEPKPCPAQLLGAEVEPPKLAFRQRACQNDPRFGR